MLNKSLQPGRVRRAVISFSRWSRKGYAVFCSLGRVIRIAVLSVVYSILVMPMAAQVREVSDTLTMREVDLEEVVVTAGRTPVGMQQVARLVTVITRAELERAPAQSFIDLLRYLPSADIRQRGPLGAQADLSIRGGTYDQTLILLNGINISDPQTGHHHLDLPVDLESISRVEFLTGPAARVFGPNALNGVVNMITDLPATNRLRLSATAGAFGLFRSSGSLTLHAGRTRHLFSPGFTVSSGHIPNTDYRGTTLFYRAEAQWPFGNFSFQAGGSDRRFGANSFYSLKYPRQFEATGGLFMSAGYRSTQPGGLSASLYLRRHNDRFELIRNNPVVPFNLHRSVTAGVQLNQTMKWRGGKSSLGADLREEHILSTVLGEPLSRPVPVRGSDTLFYTRSAHRWNMALYGEHRLELSRLTLSAGTMAHLVPGSHPLRLYPGADAAFRVYHALSLYGSVNKSLRRPTFTDMYYKSPVQQGNPHLKAEEAFSLEGGLKLHASRLRGHLTLFSRKGREMIDWVRPSHPDSLVWRSMNHSRVDFRGAEAALRYLPWEGGQGTQPLLRLERAALSWTLLDGWSSAGPLLSRYVMDYLRHQVVATADLAVGSKTVASLRVSWRDRNGSWPGAAGEVIEYQPVTLADARVTHRIGPLSLYVAASNLLDQQWVDFGGIRQPGVWLSGGMSVETSWSGRSSAFSFY